MRISDWSSDVCSSDLPYVVDVHLVPRKDDVGAFVVHPFRDGSAPEPLPQHTGSAGLDEDEDVREQEDEHPDQDEAQDHEGDKPLPAVEGDAATPHGGVAHCKRHTRTRAGEGQATTPG